MINIWETSWDTFLPARDNAQQILSEVPDVIERLEILTDEVKEKVDLAERELELTGIPLTHPFMLTFICLSALAVVAIAAACVQAVLLNRKRYTGYQLKG